MLLGLTNYQCGCTGVRIGMTKTAIDPLNKIAKGQKHHKSNVCCHIWSRSTARAETQTF